MFDFAHWKVPLYDSVEDVAIVNVAHPFEFGPRISPICIAENFPSDNKKYKVVQVGGFGETGTRGICLGHILLRLQNKLLWFYHQNESHGFQHVAREVASSTGRLRRFTNHVNVNKLNTSEVSGKVKSALAKATSDHVMCVSAWSIRDEWIMNALCLQANQVQLIRETFNKSDCDDRRSHDENILLISLFSYLIQTDLGGPLMVEEKGIFYAVWHVFLYSKYHCIVECIERCIKKITGELVRSLFDWSGIWRLKGQR